MWSTTVAAISDASSYNILDFGGASDGKTDNAKAIKSAWVKACSSQGKNSVLIPKGTYLSGPVLLEGKCNGPITFQLQGLIKAPIDVNSYSWFSFSHVDQLTLTGGGAFDGQGQKAWANNNCDKDPNCKLPIYYLAMLVEEILITALMFLTFVDLHQSVRFDFVTNSVVQGISSINSKAFHMNVLGCKDLKFISVRISAPENSRNTDGIHIGESTGISVAHSIIGTGDDCVSIGPGNNDINIFDVQCGPGHGISIGSLGKYTNEEPVRGVVVQHCTLIGTDNGVRIKTWPDSAKQGIATNLTFDDIIMKNVQNPIIIDQQYCPFGSCNEKKSSLIQISKVKFNNIRGTSASSVAISIICSKTFPCSDVELSEINLKYNGGDTSSTTANVKPRVSGQIFPSLPPA
ncbi:hypothetical protein Sjap_021675 [Stephania japonica]|uniref:Exopolygalacturonase-like n=1 Tax=Stephania japonica TaxID=461633 RepID=A0AAP0HP77_9MAGN